MLCVLQHLFSFSLLLITFAIDFPAFVFALVFLSVVVRGCDIFLLALFICVILVFLSISPNDYVFSTELPYVLYITSTGLVFSTKQQQYYKSK